MATCRARVVACALSTLSNKSLDIRKALKHGLILPSHGAIVSHNHLTHYRVGQSRRDHLSRLIGSRPTDDTPLGISQGGTKLSNRSFLSQKLTTLPVDYSGVNQASNAQDRDQKPTDDTYPRRLSLGSNSCKSVRAVLRTNERHYPWTIPGSDPVARGSSVS